jgi:hypothetical protein
MTTTDDRPNLQPVICQPWCTRGAGDGHTIRVVAKDGHGKSTSTTCKFDLRF